jgi:trigger factor
MNIQVKDISSVAKALTVEVPSEVVSGVLGAATLKLQRRAALPGFRPGKAPISLLNKKYLPDLQEEVLETLVPEYYQKAIDQAGISPVGHPKFEAITFREDRSLSFTAWIEVAPALPPLEYAGLALSPVQTESISVQVDAALARLQDEQGRLEVCPEDHVIEISDHVVVDMNIVVDEKAAEPRNGLVLQAGGRTFSPEVLEAALVGKKKGDAFVETVSFPPEHPDPKFAGKTACFEVTVQEVKKKQLPALDDELAKDVGLASLAELRERLTESMAHKEARDREERQKALLMEQLLEKYRFEVPASLVYREVQFLASRLQGRKKGGEEALYAQCEPIAQARVKRFFLLDAIAKAEGIEACDEEVDQEIEHIARQTQTAPDKIRARNDYPRILEELKSNIRTGKTLNRLYALARPSDAMADAPETPQALIE